MKNLKERWRKLFIVIQQANAFGENHYTGYVWAKSHDDANRKAKAKYPGHLVVETKQKDLVNLFSDLLIRKT